MKKGKYTHVQTLLPEIKAMLAEGKTQREVVEYYGFPDKQVIKELLKRERRKERKLAAGIPPGPRDGRGTILDPETLRQRKPMISSGCAWRISYCGIFCNSREGSEGKGQIPYGITPSMSRKGNPYDNAMAENFFSILKTECIYRHKPETFSEANEMIDRSIYFYNHERIQLKTGEVPLVQRLSV